MQLREAIKGYILDARIAPQTSSHIQQKMQRLDRFASWLEAQGIENLEDVTPNAIKGFIVSLQEHVMGEGDSEKRTSFQGKRMQPLTIKGYVRVVRAFFNWCEREGFLEGRPNPAKRLPAIKIPRYVIPAFSQEQMKTVLDSCDTSTALGFRNYTIVLLLIDTGIRVAELAGLKLEDIHESYITVFGKFSKQREVGISTPTVRALWKYIHQYRKPAKEGETRVFLSFSGRSISEKSFWYILNHICKEAGIVGVRTSPHTLRHTFAKAWLANDGDIYSLSVVLGHNDIRATMGYLKDFQSTDARAHHAERSPVEKWNLGRRQKNKKRKPDDEE
jgi:site-specific recombinase XerD